MMKKILLLFTILLLSSCKNSEAPITINTTVDIHDLNNLNYNLSTHQDILDKLLISLDNYEEIDYDVSLDTYFKLKLDHPEFFNIHYLDNKIVYIMNQDQYNEKLDEFTDLANSLKKDTEVETLRSIHDYIIVNYSYLELDKVKIDYLNLLDGTGNCFGYSNSFHLLCKILGYNVTTIKGYAYENDDHSWNVVDIDGENYLVDCTWDDPVFTGNESIYKNFSRYDYFLISLPDTHIFDSFYPDLELQDYHYLKEYTLSDIDYETIANDINNNYQNVYTYTLRFQESTYKEINFHILISNLNKYLLDRQVYYYLPKVNLHEIYLLLE